MKQSNISAVQKKQRKTYGSCGNETEWVNVRKQISRKLAGQRPKAQIKPRKLREES